MEFNQVNETKNPVSVGRVVKNLFTDINVGDISLTATAGTGTPTMTADNATGVMSAQVPESLTERAYVTTPTIT